MSGDKLFVDTNILLYFLKGNSDVINILEDHNLAISFISELELLSFPNISIDEEINIKGLIGSCQMIDYNSKIKELTIDLKRKYQLKLPDAIIAASAYFQNIPLFTGDKQFKRLEEVDVIIYEL